MIGGGTLIENKNNTSVDSAFKYIVPATWFDDNWNKDSHIRMNDDRTGFVIKWDR